MTMALSQYTHVPLVLIRSPSPSVRTHPSPSNLKIHWKREREESSNLIWHEGMRPTKTSMTPSPLKSKGSPFLLPEINKIFSLAPSILIVQWESPKDIIQLCHILKGLQSFMNVPLSLLRSLILNSWVSRLYLITKCCSASSGVISISLISRCSSSK